MDVDVDAHLLAFFDHGGEAQQHAAVGDHHGSIVLGDQRLVTGIDETHGGDVLGST